MIFHRWSNSSAFWFLSFPLLSRPEPLNYLLPSVWLLCFSKWFSHTIIIYSTSCQHEPKHIFSIVTRNNPRWNDDYDESYEQWGQGGVLLQGQIGLMLKPATQPVALWVHNLQYAANNTVAWWCSVFMSIIFAKELYQWWNFIGNCD